MGFFNIHAKPGRTVSFLLSMLLFIVCIAVYAVTSHVRHRENPKDKVVPTFSQMKDGFKRTAFERDRKGDIRLLVDTIASVRRFLISLAFLFFAVLLGLHMGIFPYMELLFLKFITFFDKIPALAILPILLIIFGLGEVSKIALILIGVFPTIALDTYLRAKAVPREQVTKGLALGASSFEVAYKVVLPQIFPEVLNTIRLNFKAMILFLIAGEAIAAAEGLGFRIFLVRRYIAMDIIIPYVIWMSLLAFLADYLVRLWIKKRYKWVEIDL
ncbi:MAG: ABC transporter permease subunit [Candidatus Aminicenantes bacterium]|nr:ABC transporter permease subunit [Candidatus Aminicenantes bacterium]NIM79961.1 ABC transporter permease subunit [Candidatus Aminicenantes bacterium]NIN19300.1 ABC transporter permease subunit [Candidatus Aminicenantes bacterium]NIN43203.1 ABC transporter permease subunit [Candidatus Aminicenantes bacterium]NIN85942.1 ABC transporter permease subunit [Candidatus Aminicenantes bacterium]